MPVTWQRKLENLRSNLREYLDDESAEDFAASIVWRLRASDLGEFDAKPRLFQAGELDRRLDVPLDDGTQLSLYLFSKSHVASSPENVERLIRCLAGAADCLVAIPKTLFPKLHLPPIRVREDEALARWILFMNWFGATFREPFRAQLEYSEFQQEFELTGNVKSWDDFPREPGFDPAPMLTCTVDPVELLKAREVHLAHKRPFPEVLASSLSKGLAMASIAAITSLLDKGGRGHAAKPSRATPKKRKSEFSNRELLVLFELRNHHGTPDNKKSDEPLTETELATRCKTSQATVHRALDDLWKRMNFSQDIDPSDRYEQLCDDESIFHVINRLDFLGNGIPLERATAYVDFEKVKASYAADQEDDDDE